MTAVLRFLGRVWTAFCRPVRSRALGSPPAGPYGGPGPLRTLTCAKSHANKMQKQTPPAIHPHTHFPGVKPSHTHLPSFPAFLTAFLPPVRSRHSYLGNAFLDRTNTRPNPKPPHARARSLLMPEGKARPGSYLKTKEVC